MVFLEISQNWKDNTCARVSFLTKLQASRPYKRDTGAGVFLWILRNFWEHLFYRTPLDDCFSKYASDNFLSLSNLKNVHILVQLYFHIIIRRSGLEVLFKSTCNFTKTRPQHRYKSFNVVQIFQRCINHYSMLYKSFKSSYRSP